MSRKLSFWGKIKNESWTHNQILAPASLKQNKTFLYSKKNQKGNMSAMEKGKMCVSPWVYVHTHTQFRPAVNCANDIAQEQSQMLTST